ncbi:MAG: thioesterase family protein [Chloroflexota bacterium]
MFSPPEIGETAETHHVVAEADLAHAFDNVGVMVLATPRLLQWIEMTATELWRRHRDDTEALLGIGFDLRHLAPSLLGAHVTARLTVQEVAGRRVTYRAAAWDHAGPVCEGSSQTYLMPAEAFLARARSRALEAADQQPRRG